MKVVYDNIAYSKERLGGVSSYWYEITKYGLQNDRYELLFYEEKGADQNIFRNRLDIPEDQLITHPYASSFLQTRMESVKVNLDEEFVYHSSYYRPVKSKTQAFECVTVHDFIHDYYFPWIKKVIHNQLKYSAIKRAAGIICVSENTYKDLKKFCPPSKQAKVEVIHNGVSNDFFPLGDLDKEQSEYLKTNHIDDDNFLLFVGGRYDYKNFRFVLNLLNELKSFKLVAVGNSFTEAEEILIDKLNLRDRTVVLSKIDNHKLNLLYNKAFALVYPSNYEGFGIPVVEAMKAGCPVLALNRSSIPEIVNGTFKLIDNLAIKSFADQVDILRNKDHRTELINKALAQSARFDWNKCASETFRFYNDIYPK